MESVRGNRIDFTPQGGRSGRERDGRLAAARRSTAHPPPGVSNIGYHGDGDTVPIPRLDWGVGMGDKSIRTALCPGGAERMARLMRLIRTGRVDPLPLTTHRLRFADVEEAFRMMQTKEDGIIKPLIMFA